MGNSRVNIKKLKEELKNIVNEYDNVKIDVEDNNDNINNFDYETEQLNNENIDLIDKIDETKKRIFDKINTLGDKSKFHNLFNKLVDKINHSSSKLDNNIIINSPINETASNIKDKIDIIFNNYLNKIKSILEKDKEYIETICIEYGFDVEQNKNEILNIIKSNLNEIRTSLNFDLNSALLYFELDDNKIETYKQQYFELFSTRLSSCQDKLFFVLESLKNKENFNKNINKTINENELDNFNKSNGNYKSIEDKLIALFDVVNQLKLEKDNTEIKTIQLFDEKINNLESKFSTIIDLIDTKNKELVNNEKLDSFFENISNQKNEFMNETRKQISSIIANNENEKRYIIELLNKIQDDNIAVSNEFAMNNSLENNKRLEELEELIVRQNLELEELLREKDQAFNYIEEILHSYPTQNNNFSENNLDSIEPSFNYSIIENKMELMIKNFQSKMENLEKSFSEKIEFFKDNLISTSSNDLNEYNGDNFYNPLIINESKNDIIENIKMVENRLLSNYENIKHQFSENIVELMNKFSEFKDSNIEGKINELIKDVNTIKYATNNQFGLGTEIKNEIKQIFSEELHNEFSMFINQKLENNEIVNKINKIENNMESLIDKIQLKNKNEFDNISNKINDIDYLTKTIFDRINVSSDEYNDIEKKLYDNFNKYEEMLSLSISKDREMFNELKYIIKNKTINESDNYPNYEFEKFKSLNDKLNNLEKLLLIQEEEVSHLIEEKNQILSLINLQEITSNKFNINDIQEISKIVDSKIQNVTDKIISSPDDITNISKSSNYNEMIQINDKIDELSNYILNNIDSYNNDLSISEILDFDIFKNYDILFNKENEVNKILSEVIKINVDDNLSTSDLMNIQSIINSYKQSLINIELDLFLLNYKIDISQEVNQIDNDTISKDILIVNKNKFDIVKKIIDSNKESLNELFLNKNKFVNEMIESYKLENDNNVLNINDITLLIDTKANLMVDKLVDELRMFQVYEINELNQKFEKIKDKLKDSSILEFSKEHNTLSNNDLTMLFEMKNKIIVINLKIKEILEKLNDNSKMIFHHIENQIEGLDIYDQIISNFEKKKNEIDFENISKIDSIKDEILTYKNNELNLFDSKLEKLNNKFNFLLNNNKLNNNELINLITNKIDELYLQINTFKVEKEELCKSISNKANYIHNLNNPKSENDFIELETDNFSLNKFFDKICIDAIKIIESNFNELNNFFDNQINTINNSLIELEKSIEKSNLSKTNNQKNIKLNNNSLKFKNNGVLSYIEWQEGKKEEISIFYNKLTELKNDIYGE